MNYVYWGLMITAFILWILLLDTLGSWRVYGKVLTDAEVEAFFKKNPLEQTELNPYIDRVLSYATFNVSRMDDDALRRAVIGERKPSEIVFISKMYGRKLFTKYYIHGLGQVDRFSKWSKKIDERYKELGKKG